MSNPSYMLNYPNNEIWEDIVGFEGLYKISNYGNIYSYWRKRLLKPYKSSNGYLNIDLRKGDGCRYSFMVHRLVALTFIPNNDSTKTYVNHKDEDKLNNYVENLEWCDFNYNINYGTRNERHNNALKGRHRTVIDGKVKYV